MILCPLQGIKSGGIQGLSVLIGVTNFHPPLKMLSDFFPMYIVIVTVSYYLVSKKLSVERYF